MGANAMSGLLSLLDDVSAIAKVAAASVDDVMSQAARAGVKAAGALIDDAAVTPKYLHGFDSSRELPMVWRIAKGSIRNKLLILLPVGLLLATFLPWAINILLMAGGAYLCFEGAEKVFHLFVHETPQTETVDAELCPVQLEESRVAGAIKTDFVLSAEIMTIALASITTGNLWLQAATLVVVAFGITVAVYGSVAAIVKADDVGVFLATHGRLSLTRAVGQGVVRVMPHFLSVLSMVGTAAMLWVGGSIILHGLDGFSVSAPAHAVHGWGVAVGDIAPVAQGMATWIAEAAAYGVIGLGVGLALVFRVRAARSVTAYTTSARSRSKISMQR